MINVLSLFKTHALRRCNRLVPLFAYFEGCAGGGDSVLSLKVPMEELEKEHTQSGEFFDVSMACLYDCTRADLEM
jgi:hypothetical protein